MKITDVKVYLAREKRTYCLVVVDTDEGISGLGASGIGARELAVKGAIEHFKPLLIGQDPFRAEHIWQLLFRGGFYPAQRILDRRHRRHRYRPLGYQGQGAGRPGL